MTPEDFQQLYQWALEGDALWRDLQYPASAAHSWAQRIARWQAWGCPEEILAQAREQLERFAQSGPQ